jgi:hypothetical protein
MFSPRFGHARFLRVGFVARILFDALDDLQAPGWRVSIHFDYMFPFALGHIAATAGMPDRPGSQTGKGDDPEATDDQFHHEHRETAIVGESR